MIKIENTKQENNVKLVLDNIMKTTGWLVFVKRDVMSAHVSMLAVNYCMYDPYALLLYPHHQCLILFSVHKYCACEWLYTLTSLHRVWEIGYTHIQTSHFNRTMILICPHIH